MMPCHTTDPKAPLYGGATARGTTPMLCAGLCILVKREVTQFLRQGGNYKSYKTSQSRLTLTGLATWAARLLFPGAVFQVMSLDDGQRSFTMPMVEDNPHVTVPWADDLHDGHETTP